MAYRIIEVPKYGEQKMSEEIKQQLIDNLNRIIEVSQEQSATIKDMTKVVADTPQYLERILNLVERQDLTIKNLEQRIKTLEEFRCVEVSGKVEA